MYRASRSGLRLGPSLGKPMRRRRPVSKAISRGCQAQAAADKPISVNYVLALGAPRFEKRSSSAQPREGRFGVSVRTSPCMASKGWRWQAQQAAVGGGMALSPTVWGSASESTSDRLTRKPSGKRERAPRPLAGVAAPGVTGLPHAVDLCVEPRGDLRLGRARQGSVVDLERDDPLIPVDDDVLG